MNLLSVLFEHFTNIFQSQHPSLPEDLTFSPVSFPFTAWHPFLPLPFSSFVRVSCMIQPKVNNDESQVWGLYISVGRSSEEAPRLAHTKKPRQARFGT